jgi:hypothetical protein
VLISEDMFASLITTNMTMTTNRIIVTTNVREGHLAN